MNRTLPMHNCLLIITWGVISLRSDKSSRQFVCVTHCSSKEGKSLIVSFKNLNHTFIVLMYLYAFILLKHFDFVRLHKYVRILKVRQLSIIRFTLQQILAPVHDQITECLKKAEVFFSIRFATIRRSHQNFKRTMTQLSGELRAKTKNLRATQTFLFISIFVEIEVDQGKNLL